MSENLLPRSGDPGREASSGRVWASLRRRGRHALVAVALAGTFGAGVTVDRLAWDGGPGAGASSSLVDRPEFRALQETWDAIQAHYVDPSAIDDAALIYGAARGMVETLGDTGHSQFLDPEEARRYFEMSEGKFVGLGIQLDYDTGQPVIVSAIDGSPADEAGLRSGDTIVAINGRSTRGMTPLQAADELRGDEGSSVTLTIERETESEPLTVTLTRRQIEIDRVTWSWLPNRVALVRLAEFSAGATDDLEQTLIEVKDAGVRGMVLDLRNNPGGLVFEAIGVASQFLPEGTTIYLVQERGGVPSPMKTTGPGEGQDLPMVVLINEGSASAAEIIASALSENGRARLIGEKTFGTGTVLLPFQLSDGSVALLGTALWLTADGDQIWRVGVAPDVEVELPGGALEVRPSDDARITRAELAASEDEQLKAAHDALSEALAGGVTER